MRYDKENRKASKVAAELSAKSIQFDQVKQENQRLRQILDGLLHEAKRLNSEISGFCDSLSRATNDENKERILDLSESINYASGLISSRLVFTDFELNPQSLARQPKIRMGIYKKFDKARRLLYKSAHSKSCTIQFEGNSFTEIDAIPALELVPFVILDNAIKYSPEHQTIDVIFEDRPSNNCHTRVTVSSTGPYVEAEELQSIIHRGVRGRNAERMNIGGDGLGLFLVDTLAKTANAKLTITSSSVTPFSYGGIPHSNFRASLDFFKSRG